DLSWTQLAQITSTNAARIFNLPGKGQIEIGYDADLTVIDPQREWTFSYLDTFYPHKSTKFPDEGRRYKGYVYATIVRGQLVYQEGRLLASGGHGRFLRPGG
ncbi:MAG: amidohydrolase family protein, partial [Limnochordia bacterium]